MNCFEVGPDSALWEGSAANMRRRPMKWLSLICYLLGVFCCVSRAADAVQVASGGATSRLAEAIGMVEFSPAGLGGWRTPDDHQALKPGDRIRTGRDGRAVVHLSDQSVVRVGPSTVIELQPPREPAASRGMRLLQGILFFFNREKPSRIEFQTPLASGAIRGTEFVVAVAEETGDTDVTVIDGRVELTALDGTGDSVSVLSGQQASVKPGARPVISPRPPGNSVVQWCVYYPAVLDADTLALDPDERAALEAVLPLYRSGDLNAAALAVPAGFAPRSVDGKAFIAALRLVIGAVPEARVWMAEVSDQPSGRALRELVAAIHFEEVDVSSVPTDAPTWLARSYLLQSKSQIAEALVAVRKAVELSPRFGLAQARVAELEFAAGHTKAAAAARRLALELSPRFGPAIALGGFMALERHRSDVAIVEFDRAVAADGAYGMAWLGRGLARAQRGDLAGARDDLQIAAALEPQRSLYRSVLGKLWSETGDGALAMKEFRLGRELDPSDPTPWLYEALHAHRANRINAAVESLETSKALNDNRSVVRARLLLDRDRAVRSADLASIYSEAGLDELAVHLAGRAVDDDPTGFDGHLFLARSYAAREDPARFDLRYETPRHGELIVANLLAPSGAGNLSQKLSQQDRLRFFEPRQVSISSATEYRSTGDWSETATLFGQLDGLGYALDGQYLSWNGNQPNGWLERTEISLQLKQELTPADSLYFQVGESRQRSGDVARHPDPGFSNRGLHVSESIDPSLYGGFHHEWSPESHTLLLATRVANRIAVLEPGSDALFVRRNAAGIFALQTDPFFDLRQESSLTLNSIDVQQLWQSGAHGIRVGGRYQSGDADTRAVMTRGLSGVVADQSVDGDIERADGYGLYDWRPVDWLRFSGGVSYSWLQFPENTVVPPVSGAEVERTKVSPRVGLTLDPWKGGMLRAAFSRSLGGVFFDDSIRLEPVQLAGFVQAYRSIAPEAAVALVPGAEFQTIGVGFDQQLRRRTFFGVDVVELSSDGDRMVGAFTQGGVAPVPDTPTSLQQLLEFRERDVTAYFAQLIGEHWVVGARYRWNEARLETRFPSVPAGTPGLESLSAPKKATLGDLELFARFFHPCGFFAGWETHWIRQAGYGFSPPNPDTDFWQHDLSVGYRFPQRRAEIVVSLLNLTGQDHRLNPLNYYIEPPRERTLAVRLRFTF